MVTYKLSKAKINISAFNVNNLKNTTSDYFISHMNYQPPEEKDVCRSHSI